jgi:pimeloyl-ACP methyl ester carboxylesterase
VLRALAWACGALALAILLSQALLYAEASRHRPVCPFDDEERPPWPARALAWARMFAAECAARFALAVSWPLGLGRVRVTETPGRRPVVLLHGYLQHRASLLWLARRLRRDGHPAYAVGLRTAFTSFERSVDELSASLERVRDDARARDVDVVAHGVSGLVVRAVLQRREHGVHRVVTLGTPHQGTLALRWLDPDPMVAAMRAGSPALRRLAGDAALGRADVVAIHSTDDALVVPAANGYYPGAFNIEIAGCGHAALLFSPRAYALLRENLAADDAPRAAVRS